MKKLLASATLLVVLSVPAFGGIIHHPSVGGHNDAPTGETCELCQSSNGLRAEETEETDTFGFDGAIGLLVDSNVYLMTLWF